MEVEPMEEVLFVLMLAALVKALVALLKS